MTTSASADGAVKHILVVGGGTAGWLTACHLAKALNCKEHTAVQVTLVESPDIPTIGVGEGTVPAIRQSLQYLGISETDLIRHCDATFKQSIRFIDWMAPTAGKTHYYHHVFDYPERQDFKLTPYWLLSQRQQSYADTLGIQSRICDLGLAPKLITQPEYDGVTNYAYHLDAAKFAALLTRHGTNVLGVHHIKANVKQVETSADGAIAAIDTDTSGKLTADLYVDCSGFQALLIGQALGVKFIAKNDVLFCDSAIAVQVPYTDPSAPIASSTLATAQSAGWIWDIGLPTRRGVGYVYSSKYCSSAEAETALRAYIGKGADALSYRQIPMHVGYREHFWQKNCVAIGLSQGFVEPLEATGLLVYDACARMLADTLPAHSQQFGLAAARFNQHVRSAWGNVIDFIKLHYCLSDRQDSAFWRDNRDENTIPLSLQHKLAQWRCQVPSAYDFPGRFDIFHVDNYLYVLYGMHFDTDISMLRHRLVQHERASQLVASNQQYLKQALQVLLPHRQLIERIKQYGLSAI
ncbi:tryptophan 7-halogenase [Rheinheimera baltica]|uniref:tryptophan halogenase family protein n=1 Tax=Rheinheimera baltica TaxID=67576 RepID=UPI00273FAFB7|nr:tryptophan halogenase family protein [Rheinheimera baltica]MDP5142827.1 tryptophan 7-halogenase [Rheinheimera baltica]